MSRPIVVSCARELELTPAQFRERFLDVSEWADFDGYGPLPGIESARFLEQTPDLVGSRIEVQNRDGSRHVERVVRADDEVLQLELGEFSPPLSRLASHFVETLRFEPAAEGRTRIERSMALYPKSAWSRPMLWGISRLLRRALEKHLHSL